MFRNTFLLNSNELGLSLLETLIGLSMAGALALFGMQLFKQQATAQRTVEANYEVSSVVQQIKSVLSQPVNCAASLQGLSPASGVPTLLKKKVDTLFENVYAINTSLPENIKISSYSLSKDFPGLASNEAILKIEFSRGNNTIKDKITKSFKIVYTVDGSGNILTCYAFNNVSDTFWIQSQTQPNDIYYGGGNVGIGTAVPNATFQVEGTITGKAAILNNSGVIDFSTGNFQYTNAPCGAYQLNNMKDGATYTFVVKGTASQTCSFNAFSDSGTSTLTIHLPPDHGATTDLTHTLYTFVVIGSDVYTAWIAGY